MFDCCDACSDLGRDVVHVLMKRGALHLAFFNERLSRNRLLVDKVDEPCLTAHGNKTAIYVSTARTWKMARAWCGIGSGHIISRLASALMLSALIATKNRRLRFWGTP